jgi:hypothetical protein
MSQYLQGALCLFEEHFNRILLTGELLNFLKRFINLFGFNDDLKDLKD